MKIVMKKISLKLVSNIKKHFINFKLFQFLQGKTKIERVERLARNGNIYFKYIRFKASDKFIITVKNALSH